MHDNKITQVEAEQLNKEITEYFQSPEYLRSKEEVTRKNAEMREYFLDDFLKKFPGFLMFLEETDNADVLDYSYDIMFQVCYYLRYLFLRWKISEIREILIFLDEVFSGTNIEARNVVGVGFLENLHIISDVLPDIIKLFPKELYKDFMKHYEHYITGDDFETIMKKASEKIK